MSEWRLLRMVIWRELYSRRKAFLVTTALVTVVVAASLLIVSLTTADDESPVVAVGVVGEREDDLEQALHRTLGPDVRVEMEAFDGVVAGREALRTESICALVIDDHEVVWARGTAGWVQEAVAGAMSAVNLARAAAELGLSPAETQALLRPIQGELIDYEEGEAAVIALSVITVIIMFLAIIAYGQWIAYAVVEEKANRVAELILGALSPNQLLTAKMISLGGMGLVQLILVGSVGLMVGTLLTGLELPNVAASTWGWLVFWFLIGYAFYGSFYAAAGSLAADTQEAGSYIGPLNIIPGLGYMVGVIAFSAGAETLLRVLSLIPLWSPLIMPGRIAQGTAAAWEVALAISLMVVTTVVVVRLSSRVYLGGMTQATRRVGWRQAFRGGQDLASSPG